MKALVTGATGFLGGALAKALAETGYELRVLVRRESPILAALGAEVVLGDIRDRAAVEKACHEVEIVFHTAALASGWGDARTFEDINVGGTRSLLDAARRAGARAFVYTSSPSVVFDGKDIAGGDESLPFARSFLAHYPRTKALAEQEVAAAAAKDFLTVSLRPHLIWGPGDRNLLPRLLERAGKLKRVGAGDPLTDTTYIDNCVHAHLLAGEKLLSGGGLPRPAYFISDDEPVGIWTMANRMLAAAGGPAIEGRVPGWLAYGAGALLEGLHGLVGSKKEPLVTRFAASQLSRAQWFDIGNAKRELGYAPPMSIDEGLARLAASFGRDAAQRAPA